MRIEICGGIGSGKTTLANSLGKFGFSVANEKVDSTSFLDEFYSNPELFAFETEISFLLQHSVEIKKLYNSHKIVCDYSFEQDFAYAINNLNEAELEMYKSVFDEIKRPLNNPDLIIRLESSTETKKKRIKLRGRINEQMIDDEYIEKTDALISNRLSNTCIPVLCIDSEKNDFREMIVTKQIVEQLNKELQM